LPIIFDERLVEFSQGNWEGKPRNEIYTLEVQNLINKQKTCFRPPGGKSLRMLKNRATNFLETEIMNKFWQNDLESELVNLENDLGKGFENELVNLESLEKIRQEKNSEQKTIAIFGHGMWIKLLLMEILHLDQIITVNLELDNCSLTELEFGDFGWKLYYLNRIVS